jgi:hypothetical protein
MDTRVGATRLRRLRNYNRCTLPLPPPLLLPSLSHATPLFCFRFSVSSSLSPLPSPSSSTVSCSTIGYLWSSRPLFMDTLHPPLSQPRRRSVDVGGLSLALGSQGLGQGWVGWDESEIDTEEQQLLCVILRSCTAVSPLIFARPVSLNFLAICTIIHTPSSMLSSDRTYI